jgi:hypothetical protein
MQGRAAEKDAIFWHIMPRDWYQPDPVIRLPVHKPAVEAEHARCALKRGALAPLPLIFFF